MTCAECGLGIPDGEAACPICGFAVDPAAVAQAERLLVLPRPRLVFSPARVPDAPPAPPAPPAPVAAPESPRAKRWLARIGAFFRAIGRGITCTPAAFDHGLVWLIRYELDFLPDPFERNDLRVRAFALGIGRAAGGFIALAVWRVLRLALLVALLAVKCVAIILFLIIAIIVGVASA